MPVLRGFLIAPDGDQISRVLFRQKAASMKECVSGADDADDAACAVLIVFANLEFHNRSNKWMLATAGVACLVYSESSARRARLGSFIRPRTPPR